MDDVVKPQPVTTEASSEAVQTQEPVAAVAEPQATQPGEKTDPALLLKSLQEERAKRKALEEQLALQSNNTPSDDVFSDEGRAIVDKFVKPLEQELKTLREQNELKDIYAQYPDLKGLSSEFDEYRKEYPRHKMGNVAKLFLTEKGLLDAPRKGLEKTTGGQRSPVPSMTSEDSENLRKTNYKKWKEMLLKDQLPKK